MKKKKDLTDRIRKMAEEGKIEFAKEDRIAKINKDLFWWFVDNILLLKGGVLITDRSRMTDFDSDDERSAELNKRYAIGRIKHDKGVDVSNVYDKEIVDILEKIQENG